MKKLSKDEKRDIGDTIYVLLHYYFPLFLYVCFLGYLLVKERKFDKELELMYPKESRNFQFSLDNRKIYQVSDSLKNSHQKQ